MHTGSPAAIDMSQLFGKLTPALDVQIAPCSAQQLLCV